MIEVVAMYTTPDREAWRDAEITRIVTEFGGARLGSGYFVPTSERDIQFSFDDEMAAAGATAKLREAGFKAKLRVDGRDSQ